VEFRKGMIFEAALTQYRYSLANNEAVAYQKMVEAIKARLEGKIAALG
jgi:hypothetical protein